jgi:hypothetical protein
MARAPEFHEDYRREHAVKVGSDRGFGLTMAAVCVVIGIVIGIRSGAWATVAAALYGVAAIFLVLALLGPGWLTRVNRLWLRFGLLLNRIVSPLVLALLFYTTVTPTGLILRLFGKDPLHLKREPQATSYWIERTPPGPAPETMTQQF